MIELYLGVFLSAFLAATLLPVVSEAVLAGAAVFNAEALFMLWLVATTGNTLGAVVNWWLGREAQRFRHKRWFPVPANLLRRAEGFYQRYGWPSLLLAWTPWLGDPLTVVAGLLRVPLAPFVLLVGAGKGARYAVLLLFTEELQALAQRLGLS